MICCRSGRCRNIGLNFCRIETPTLSRVLKEGMISQKVWNSFDKMAQNAQNRKQPSAPKYLTQLNNYLIVAELTQEDTNRPVEFNPAIMYAVKVFKLISDFKTTIALKFGATKRIRGLVHKEHADFIRDLGKFCD
jgi:hypothetical protein